MSCMCASTLGIRSHELFLAKHYADLPHGSSIMMSDLTHNRLQPATACVKDIRLYVVPWS